MNEMVQMEARMRALLLMVRTSLILHLETAPDRERFEKFKAHALAKSLESVPFMELDDFSPQEDGEIRELCRMQIEGLFAELVGRAPGQ